MEYPISLYYDTEVPNVKTLDLCRGDDDYRKVHIVDDGHRKLVIKYLSNTFSDKRRIECFNLEDDVHLWYLILCLPEMGKHIKRFAPHL